MNYEITTTLVEALRPYIGDKSVNITTEEKNWKGEASKSDYVEVDKKNSVGFEVMNNEIIVFYFTDHTHFEDYTSELAEGEDDYVKRAIEFLIDLFRYKICNIKHYKGDKMYSEQYFISYGDGREDDYIGGTMWSIISYISPFGRKRKKQTVYFYDKQKGCFVTRSSLPTNG